MMRRSIKGMAVWGVALLILVGATAVGIPVYRLFYTPMLNSSTDSVLVRIDKSTSAASFVHGLKAQHLVTSDRLFLSLIRLEGLSSHLKAGIYQVQVGESAHHFLDRVIHGDVLTESFKIIEGTTSFQVSHGLEQAPYLTYHASDWSAIVGAYHSPEGLLLADTYHYDAGSESHVLLQRSHKALEAYLDAAWLQRSDALPYQNAYELLIAASILEKETALPEEKRLISGVIVNRLKKHMPLQMDPTVIYALGSSYHGKLKHDDLQVDSPYNTYRHRGLPPTPIAMVGREAIDAAAHPEVTDYLYFVASGDGHHTFSVNYQEQRQAVSRFLRK